MPSAGSHLFITTHQCVRYIVYSFFFMVSPTGKTARTQVSFGIRRPRYETNDRHYLWILNDVSLAKRCTPSGIQCRYLDPSKSESHRIVRNIRIHSNDIEISNGCCAPRFLLWLIYNFPSTIWISAVALLLQQNYKEYGAALLCSIKSTQPHTTCSVRYYYYCFNSRF